MRVAVIVSEDPSDLYFANCLVRSANVIAVLVERQYLPRDTTPRLIKALRLLNRPGELYARAVDLVSRKYWKAFGADRSPAAFADFGNWGTRIDVPDDVDVLFTEGAYRVNDKEYVDWIRAHSPNLIALCGPSILKSEMLSIASIGTLNLHGGLSQFYRGLFTTDWALHNGEPECIGATVHFVSAGIDDGDILLQGRPELGEHDNPYTAYEKVVRRGVCMMLKSIEDLAHGVANPKPLCRPGKLYLGRDFTRRVKHRTWRAVQRGVLKAYLRDREARDDRVSREIVNEFSWPAEEIADNKASQ